MQNDYSAMEGMKRSTTVPQEVQEFITQLHVHLTSNPNLERLSKLFNEEFNKLSEEHYAKDKTWPSLGEVSHLFMHNDTTATLYAEMYHRHMIARCSNVSWDQRREAFENYDHLFIYILRRDEKSDKRPVALQLPNDWMFGIIDEFIYQFQNFTTHSAKLLSRRRDTAQQDGNEHMVWHFLHVLNVLEGLATLSGIREHMAHKAAGKEPPVHDFAVPLYTMLGYFALYGQLRLHCMFGNYHLAVKALDDMRFHKVPVHSFCHVAACHVSTALTAASSYMMLRRYRDAICVCSDALLFMKRSHQTSSAQSSKAKQLYDREAKEKEKVCTILAMCLALYPMNIDDTVRDMLRESMPDRLAKLQRGDIETFETCFGYAGPKYIGAEVNFNNESLHPIAPPPGKDYQRNQQCKVFISEVRSQLQDISIINTLRLYRTIPLAKLASLVEPNLQRGEKVSNEAIRNTMSRLLSLKQKLSMSCVVPDSVDMDTENGGTINWRGRFAPPSTDIDFYVDKGLVHIVSNKVSDNLSEYFLKQIENLDKFENQLRCHAKTMEVAQTEHAAPLHQHQQQPQMVANPMMMLNPAMVGMPQYVLAGQPMQLAALQTQVDWATQQRLAAMAMNQPQ